jgi:predicted PurR-regulated permease PerM
MQKDVRDIFNEVNTAFRRFINGALADSTLVFIVSSIAFAIAGLKAPLLFGLFCGITNIIPYAGPYIGGAPAVIVAFSQSTSIGIFVLIALIIIQTLEGNFIQPLIMSKSARLHPVTVIIGLLIFGHFFGIIGMAISTPVIGACKALFLFFDEKYHILDYNKN